MNFSNWDNLLPMLPPRCVLTHPEFGALCLACLEPIVLSFRFNICA